MKGLLKRGNKLSKKFIIGVVAILLCTLAGTLLVNAQIAEKVYFYKQRAYVEEIGEQLKAALGTNTSSQQAIDTIENQEKVFIAYSAEADTPDVMAYELREVFKEKGVGFQKFWLWDQDYETAIQNGSQFRLYSQEKMNYSILVEYLPMDSGMYAIAAIIPDAHDFIEIVNQLGCFIYSMAILIAIVLIYFLTRRIINPLEDIHVFTKNFSAHVYQPLQIQTGDELEDVANSLNAMALDLEQYQKMLEEKNNQMQQLLHDVAHDLKMPISLIGMYASGIQDGLDDGTFLQTIIQQNRRMSQMVEKLLYLSRITQVKPEIEEVAVAPILIGCINEQHVLFDQRSLELAEMIDPKVKIFGNKEVLHELFANLLSNAAKYASFGRVSIKLWQQDVAVLFRITNNIENTELDIDRIWQPFYVGEPSRNKDLSGTGLGLAIVKKLVDTFHYSISCEQEGTCLAFTVVFPLCETENGSID